MPSLRLADFEDLSVDMGPADPENLSMDLGPSALEYFLPCLDPPSFNLLALSFLFKCFLELVLLEMGLPLGRSISNDSEPEFPENPDTWSNEPNLSLAPAPELDVLHTGANEVTESVGSTWVLVVLLEIDEDPLCVKLVIGTGVFFLLFVGVSGLMTGDFVAVLAKVCSEDLEPCVPAGRVSLEILKRDANV